MITDRDLVWLVAQGLDPQTTEVGQFVHAPLHTASVADGLSDVVRKLREHGVRRLPIVDPERRLVGIVSLDDIFVLLGSELGDAAAAIRSELEREHTIGSARSRKGAS
jgi:signal-transduction protein with cAMP-binding, CBS, and nucleotidyltransferase domain